MESKKKEEILARLSELETEYQMRILSAVEYGSHAYGYASEDSDHDIRLIYVYPMERYLSLSSPKDSIDVMEGDLDISGWELKRTLSHVAKSNATFWEWIQSPVILDRLGFMEQLKNAARPYFAEKTNPLCEDGDAPIVPEGSKIRKETDKELPRYHADRHAGYLYDAVPYGTAGRYHDVNQSDCIARHGGRRRVQKIAGAVQKWP